MDTQHLQSIIDFVQGFDWGSWVTAIATLVLAILTFVYVRLTRQILASQSDPFVILTVVHDEERPTILQLVARNVGTGLAHDISFEYSRPLPAKAFGLSKDNAEEAPLMEKGPLIEGIPALGPGECRKLDWGQYGGLTAALGNEVITATCRFKKNGKDMPPTTCPLSITSFADTVAVKSSFAKATKELENISSSIQKIASQIQQIKVEVVSLPPEDHE